MRMFLTLYTIGFTGKTAQEFFEALQGTKARHLLDIRLRNNSQLAGFTKKGNIEFFVAKLTHLVYREMPLFAPEEAMFKQYRSDGDWDVYEASYLALLNERRASENVDRDLLADGAVLLCSEPTPERCHRRLAAEYLIAETDGETDLVHL